MADLRGQGSGPARVYACLQGSGGKTGTPEKRDACWYAQLTVPPAALVVRFEAIAVEGGGPDFVAS
jgi:hypothetical protein